MNFLQIFEALQEIEEEEDSLVHGIYDTEAQPVNQLTIYHWVGSKDAGHSTCLSANPSFIPSELLKVAPI